jgi:hypothetical protein
MTNRNTSRTPEDAFRRFTATGAELPDCGNSLVCKKEDQVPSLHRDHTAAFEPD